MNQTTVENLMKITEESYQKIASSFSETRNFSWGELDLAIEKYLKNNCKILDLGCGNGRLLIALKKYLKNFDYTGVDSCKELITKASLLSSRAKAEQSEAAVEGSQIISLVHQNILDLQNFSDNSFDTIFMIASLNHIPSKEWREKLLNDIQKILRPGGFLIITNWNLWNIYNKKSFWNYWIKSRFSFLLSSRNRGSQDFHQIPFYKEMSRQDIITFWQNKFPLYYHAFTLTELKKVLQKNNFKILENYYVNNGKKDFWFKANNILTIGQKI